LEKFKYFGTTIKNKNFIREQIKSRLNSGDICYHKYKWNDQVKEDEMDRACSKCRGEDEYMQNIRGKASREATTRKN
jgi:hypothetical protein